MTDTLMIAAITRLAQRLHDDPLMQKTFTVNDIKTKWKTWTTPAENFADHYPPD